ncbi:hypothetical protein [Estrella lausannensis]|uniref:Putative membrane protein n=1 Tax=Estrella lausannensis TaxID=483423 RepID=A0A0H5DRW3_9BACT|nr:hypothetical protein [Estrella lausannensis]CRX39367.1 putative membrane protein [Estrella lausannensis]
MKNKEENNTCWLVRCGYFLPVFFVILSLFLTPFALPSLDGVSKNTLSNSLTLAHQKPVKAPIQSVTEETLNALIKQGYFIAADLDTFLPAPAFYFSSQESPLFLDEAFSHDYLNLENLSSKHHPPTYLG